MLILYGYFNLRSDINTMNINKRKCIMEKRDEMKGSIVVASKRKKVETLMKEYP